MTRSNQVPPNCSDSARLAGQKKRLENQYWSRPAPKSSETSERARLLKQIGNWLLTFFVYPQQVRIWTKETKAGTTLYAYDPTTQSTISRVSEAEMRVWLEERYQQ
ncbi:MAG: hypothetical protein WA949_15035 [Phormidesmis sp.]